ncbi:ABC transporter ATP-binding protein [Limobrevibacterium gyesilva]|uniref:ABC transporter ATP-binding protein n=1 Tax=Limobrevibacterium gyesilva TaxID=2991712 RepID=A0AA41YVY5_9PROT|nr:ABC transporter ATP-binding protein [Limobrevibacterium gyesilva]MCW3477473.1 ABC transporter ATP-binding protein [Limobrevibacterium gyesilva]
MLEIEDVNTFRGPAHVLNGVSLNVGAQEVVCLVGRNGAGKTTTMESINGLLPVRSGAIRFRGEDMTRLPAYKRARRGIGYAPEGASIFPDLTVSENLMMSRWLSEKAVRARGDGAEVNIEDRMFSVFPEVRPLLNRRGLNLSGGQKKMVAIARAMALSPYLLLLDEAFEGLAPAVVGRFRDAVITIKQMGISILIAESNLVNAAAVADRLYAMDRGEIIFHGSPQDALANEDVMRTLRG